MQGREDDSSYTLKLEADYSMSEEELFHQIMGSAEAQSSRQIGTLAFNLARALLPEVYGENGLIPDKEFLNSTRSG